VECSRAPAISISRKQGRGNSLCPVDSQPTHYTAISSSVTCDEDGDWINVIPVDNAAGCGVVWLSEFCGDLSVFARLPLARRTPVDTDVVFPLAGNRSQTRSRTLRCDQAESRYSL